MDIDQIACSYDFVYKRVIVVLTNMSWCSTPVCIQNLEFRCYREVIGTKRFLLHQKACCHLQTCI